MLSEKIESILNEGVEGFNLYQDNFFNEDVFADPFSSFTCPIAKYLEFRTGTEPAKNYAVGATYVCVIQEKVRVRLPEWAERISVLSFRHGKSVGIGMTKGELNNILFYHAK